MIGVRMVTVAVLETSEVMKEHMSVIRKTIPKMWSEPRPVRASPMTFERPDC